MALTDAIIEMKKQRAQDMEEQKCTRAMERK